MKDLGALLEELADDAQTDGQPSDDIRECNAVLFDPTKTRAEKAKAVGAWLRDWQPCLFGRIAATKGWMDYCVISEGDILRGDEHVRDVIQTHRRVWKQRALRGETHGFIILVVSEALAQAKPGSLLRDFGLRLCELYLGRANQNEILLDWLYLHADNEECRRWKVGVNYFSQQGDKRWWHDHRFPGGVAYSMNSVGHMARKLAEDGLAKTPELAAKCAGAPREKLVAWALKFAMQTILKASEGQCPGTRLLPRTPNPVVDAVPERDRTRVLGEKLCPFSEHMYAGWYHTDETIPADYFRDARTRPAEITERQLLFTYLHSADDEAFESMGLGEDVSALRANILKELEMSEVGDN